MADDPHRHAMDRVPQTAAEVALEMRVTAIEQAICGMANADPVPPVSFSAKKRLEEIGRFATERMEDEANEKVRRAFIDATRGNRRGLVLWILAVSQLVVGALAGDLFHPITHLLK